MTADFDVFLKFIYLFMYSFFIIVVVVIVLIYNNFKCFLFKKRKEFELLE